MPTKALPKAESRSRTRPRCIYCRAEKDAGAFTREHVLHEGFGRFKNGLTLIDMVCGDCNQAFANDIDRYLLRDTIDGMNRFLKKTKDPAEYKSEGNRSTLESRIDAGPWKGLRLMQRVVDGELMAQPFPQVGFALSTEGPYEWYGRDALPKLEELKAKFPAGSNLLIEFFEVTDEKKVLDELRAMGVGGDFAPLKESRPANWRAPNKMKVENRQLLGLRFARAVAKICFNFFAWKFGRSAALMPEFDEIRKFIRFGEPRPEWFKWSGDNQPFTFEVPHEDGHVVAVAFNPADTAVVGLVSLHMFARYRMVLAPKSFKVQVSDEVHFFDLKTMEAAPLTIRLRKA